MPKALNTVALSLAADRKVIAADFATFGKFTINDFAKAAMIRRVTDQAAFNEIRLVACAAWLMANKGYGSEVAAAMIDKTKMRGANATIGKLPKRNADQETDYIAVKGAWSYYLTVNQIFTLNTNKVTKKAKRAPRTPDAPTVPAPSAPVPIAPQAFTAPKLASMADVTAQTESMIAALSKLGQNNAKILKGDKGAALRDLIAHNVKEIARIATLAD